MLLVHLVNILVCSVSWLGIAGCIIARLDGGSVVACALTSSTRSLTPSTPLGEASRQQGKGWGEKSLDALQKKCAYVSGWNIYGKRSGWDYDHEGVQPCTLAHKGFSVGKQGPGWRWPQSTIVEQMQATIREPSTITSEWMQAGIKDDINQLSTDWFLLQ